VSTDAVSFQERMELIEAVREEDVEKVKVRRLLEAVSSTDYGPSRAVCPGLGQWTRDAVGESGWTVHSSYLRKAGAGRGRRGEATRPRLRGESQDI
jgi:hypothetical protein